MVTAIMKLVIRKVANRNILPIIAEPVRKKTKQLGITRKAV